MTARFRRKPPLPSILAAVFMLLILTGYVLAGRIDSASLILAQIQNLPPTLGYIGFVATLVAAVVSGIIPLSALAMASGILYGVGIGFIISGIGLSIGASLAFAISRHWLRQLILAWVSRHISVAALDHNILLRGWQLALLLRISPVAPFGVVSYAFGLTSITYRQFMVGLLGSFPAMLGYVYSGALSGEMLRAFLSGNPQIDRLRLGLLAAGFVATLAAIVLLKRIIQDALAEARNNPAGGPSPSAKTELPLDFDPEPIGLPEAENQSS